jgi:hypothetical protein
MRNLERTHWEQQNQKNPIPPTLPKREENPANKNQGKEQGLLGTCCNSLLPEQNF